MTASTVPKTITFVDEKTTTEIEGGANPEKEYEDLNDQPTSSRLHDMANSGGTMVDLVSVSDVFSSNVNDFFKSSQASVAQHVADAPQHVLPQSVQAIAAQLRSDREEEVALQGANGVPRHEDLQALLQKQSTAESEDSRRDAFRLSSGRGESSPALQYGAIWEGHDEMIHDVRLKSLAGLRIKGGLSDKCKQFVCQSNHEVRQKVRPSKGLQTSGATPCVDQDEIMHDKDGQTQPTDQPLHFIGSQASSSSTGAPSTSTAEFFGAGVCKCLIQVQEMNMEQFRRGSYHRSKYTRLVYGEPGTVLDRESGKLITKNPLPDMKHWRPDINDKKSVWACTLFMEHTCLSLPPRVDLQGARPVREDLISCAVSNAPSSSVIPSSASALEKSGNFGRKVTSTMHTTLLAHKFEHVGRSWTVKDVFQEMQLVDPAAKMTMAHKVLRNLRSAGILSPEFNISLLHGLATKLSEQGFGVVFHLVNSSTVINMIEDIARKRYSAVCKRHGTPTAAKVPFNVKNIATSIAKYSEDPDDTNKYLLGWTLVPKNMMYGNLSSFIPIDAIDGAAMRGSAAGTLFIRATKDANDHVHPVSISHLLASECKVALQAHMEAEEQLLLLSETAGIRYNHSPLDVPGRVTITDGGPALMSVQKERHPMTALWRCEFHMKLDLKSRCPASLPIYEQLLQLGFGRQQQADGLFDRLPANSPLRKIPKEQICQAFLPTSLFGNKTNNFAEISNHMLDAARNQKELFNSLLATVAVLKTRHDALVVELKDYKAKALFKPSATFLQPGDKWPERYVTQVIFKEQGDLNELATSLTDVKRVDSDGFHWDVRISRDILNKVDLHAIQSGKFHLLCSCGKGGVGKLWCKCTQAVFRQMNTIWQAWVPTWSQAETWETQLGSAFHVPDGKEIIEGLTICHAMKTFHPYVQPELQPTNRGRPLTVNATASDKRREKSILENIKAASKVQTLMGEFAIGSSMRNPGGLGTKKKCSNCGNPEHRAPKCPRGVPQRQVQLPVYDGVAVRSESLVMPESLGMPLPEAAHGSSSEDSSSQEEEHEDGLERCLERCLEVPQMDSDDMDVEGSGTAAFLEVAPVAQEAASSVAHSVTHSVLSASHTATTSLSPCILEENLCSVDTTEPMALNGQAPNVALTSAGHVDAESIARLAVSVAEKAAKEAECAAALAKERPGDTIRIQNAETLQERAVKALKNAEESVRSLQELKGTMDVGIRVNPSLVEAFLGKGMTGTGSAVNSVDDHPQGTPSVNDSAGAQLEETLLVDDGPKTMEAIAKSGTSREVNECGGQRLAAAASSQPAESLPTLLNLQISKMTIKDIQAALRRLGITPLKGNKSVLVKQLEEAKQDANQDHMVRKNASKEQLAAGIQLLKDQGYEIFDVERDGACFFRCMAMHFECDEDAHDTYRSKVASSLGKHKDFIGIYLERKQGENVEDVVTRFAAAIRSPTEWVGEDGIILSALTLEVEIIVHDITHEKPLHYKNFAHELYANPTIEVFYDGVHYQYLRHPERQRKPEFPIRRSYGELRDDDAQARFDEDAARWGRHCEKHEVAARAWKNSLVSDASLNGDLDRGTIPPNLEMQVAEEDVLMQDQQANEVSFNRWQKPRGLDKRMSSDVAPSSSRPGEQPCSWDFYMRYKLDGSEKACLLWAGAHELHPELPIEALVPLEGRTQFKTNSALTSFWTLMHGDLSEDAYFYFVRKRGSTCDGVMLLQRKRRQRARGSEVVIEIVRCSASGAKGNGSLLVFHLCALLHAVEPKTLIRVILREGMRASRPFWEKVGFKAEGNVEDVVEDVEMLEAATTSAATTSSTGRPGAHELVVILSMNVMDKEMWEAYVKKRQPAMCISVEAISREAIIDDDVLKDQWSKQHWKTWDALVMQRIHADSRLGRQSSMNELVEALEKTRTRIGKVPEDLIGSRVTVKGNGSCWLYAFMAGYAGILDHANPCAVSKKTQVEKLPSAVDYSVSKSLILAMKDHVKAKKMFEKDDKERVRHEKAILALKWATKDERGTPGATYDVYALLANLMEVTIVVLDLSTPEWFTMFDGDEEGTLTRCPMDILEVRLRCMNEEQKRFVVVEFNGVKGLGGHFAGYLPHYNQHFVVHSFLKKHFPGSAGTIQCLR
jgi:hypothetical protein